MQKKVVKYVHKTEQYKVLCIMPLALIVSAFLYETPTQLFSNLWKGILWHNRLLSDAFEIMGIGAALFNAGLLGMISVGFMMCLNMKPNGVIMMMVYLMMGFGFLGKNPVNIIPFFIGGYLNSRLRDISFKSVAVNTLLSTALSPIVSSIPLLFSNPLLGIVVAFTIGVGLGIILPTIAHKTLVAHQGYSLYNMGFAAGLTSIIFYSLLKSRGISFEVDMYTYTAFPVGVVLILALVFASYIVIGYLENERSFTGFRQLHQFSGILVSDFTRMVGFPVTLINQGVLGLVCLIICSTFGVVNGAVLSGVFSVVGFASFGKHLKNTLPIMLGVLLGSYVLVGELTPTVLLMTMFFATTLAPISGEYGILAGIIAGFCHLLLVGNFITLHGGMNLYNNGFSGAILAMVLVPCIQLMLKEDE